MPNTESTPAPVREDAKIVEPTQSKPEFLIAAAPWAETLSKAVAGIVIALYACGFLIVSLYHSKFGFVGTNPFRPRVLAAGAWFSSLLASQSRLLSVINLFRGKGLRET